MFVFNIHVFKDVVLWRNDHRLCCLRLDGFGCDDFHIPVSRVLVTDFTLGSCRLEQFLGVDEALPFADSIHQGFFETTFTFRQRVQSRQAYIAIEELGGALFATHEMHSRSLHRVLVEHVHGFTMGMGLIEPIRSGGGLHHCAEVEHYL